MPYFKCKHVMISNSLTYNHNNDWDLWVMMWPGGLPGSALRSSGTHTEKLSTKTWMSSKINENSNLIAIN